jgi:hypothetical protein
MLGRDEDSDAAAMRRIAKMLLPANSRRSLRKLHRRMVFRRAMRRFMARPDFVLQPGNTLLETLIYGWGNEGWCAREEYLAACVRQVLTSDGPILECGSGLTTVLLGAAAGKRGRPYVALEHLPGWADRVRRQLVRLRIDAVALHTVPLRDFGRFDWYDAPLDQLPSGFDLVICDGPPGGTRGGRYGLVPVMRRHLAPRCVIMIDDVVRAEERVMAHQWSAELGAPLERLGTRKPYMQLTMPEAQLELRA